MGRAPAHPDPSRPAAPAARRVRRRPARGNVSSAGGSGADFSKIIISASGNRELQTHVDLVVARTLRLLALTADSDIWTIWIDAYRETLALLDADDRPGAVPRYRLIYSQVRAALQTTDFGS